MSFCQVDKGGLVVQHPVKALVERVNAILPQLPLDVRCILLGKKRSAVDVEIIQMCRHAINC